MTIDDDIGYPYALIAELILAAITKKDVVVGSSGQNLSFWGISEPFPGNTILSDPHSNAVYQDVLEGFGGIAYHANYIDENLMKKFADKDFSKECFFSDDIVISFVLALTGYSRMRVFSAHFQRTDLFHFRYGLEDDALHKGGGLESEKFLNPEQVDREKYQKCFSHLKEALETNYLTSGM